MATANRQAYLKAYREANRERLAAEDRARYAANREAALELRKRYRESHQQEVAQMKREYRAANRDALIAKDRQYYLDNKGRIAAQRREYRKAKAPQLAADNRKRQAAKLQRTPAWLTADDLWLIREAYELARLRTELFGFPWHVDHIYPLQGRRVSGLHVPTNLQVIPGVENCRKNNSFE